MSIEWKSGDMAVRKDGGPVFQLRDRFYSGLMGETTMWSIAPSPLDSITGSVPQSCLCRPIRTLEENQARLRREQAAICKRIGYSIGPKQSIEIEMSLAYKPIPSLPNRDSIADLARTAIRAIEYAHVLFPVSSIEAAKQAIELILAEATKP